MEATRTTGPRGEWTRAPPGQPPDDLAIAARPGGGMPVLARCADRLLVARAAAGGRWEQLLDGAMGMTHLHLLASEDALWAGWCEPLVGPVYVAVP